MLWVQAEVGVLPGHVAGVDVVVLVPGDGVSADGESKLKKKDSEKNGNAQGDPWTAGAAVQASGLGQTPSDWLVERRPQKTDQLPSIHVFVRRLTHGVMPAGQHDDLVIQFVLLEFLDHLLGKFRQKRHVVQIHGW